MDPDTRKSSASPAPSAPEEPSERTIEALETELSNAKGDDDNWTEEDLRAEEYEGGSLRQSGSSWR